MITKNYRLKLWIGIILLVICTVGASYIEFYYGPDGYNNRGSKKIEARDTILPGGHLFRIDSKGELTHLKNACRQCREDESQKTKNSKNLSDESEN